MWPWLIKVSGWFIRFSGGFLPIGTKPVSEWLGKTLWVVGMILIVNFVLGFFHKPTSNTNANVPRVVALPFSHIGNVTQENQQKIVEQKRKWWQPIPYISVAGETGYSRNNSGIWDDRIGLKTEVGLRLDF